MTVQQASAITNTARPFDKATKATQELLTVIGELHVQRNKLGQTNLTTEGFTETIQLVTQNTRKMVNTQQENIPIKTPCLFQPQSLKTRPNTLQPQRLRFEPCTSQTENTETTSQLSRESSGCSWWSSCWDAETQTDN